MPKYREAVYGGETVVLENATLRLELHKRRTGWGWGELYVPDGAGGMRFFAVLEHLGELDAEGLPHPLRLEAEACRIVENEAGKELHFAVRTQRVEPPDSYYGNESPLAGTVVLSLAKNENVIGYKMVVDAQFGFKLKRLRGPWLRVGADSFGADKTDAIFPGIEWLEGAEWSSGTDWFDHPERLRLTPHPHKVSFPCLAISQSGMGLGLWYKADEILNTTPPAYPQALVRYPQPVFASPNFIDCRNDHILGLMWPSVRQGLAENALAAADFKAAPGLRFVFDAEIAVVPGRSLDVLAAWVQRYGLPDPGEPRWDWPEAYRRIIHAYDTNLWVEGQGWARRWMFRGDGELYVPECVRTYIAKGSDQALVVSLKRKVAWVEEQLRLQPEKESTGEWALLASPYASIKAKPQLAAQIGDSLLALQTPEGDFPFEPQGRHNTGHNANAAYWRPLGLAGDSAVDLCATATLALLEAYKLTQKEAYKEAARRALEFAMRFTRPEGGDWWETPLRSPNLLAAGNAAMAYYLGYELFGEAKYKQKAIWWIRGVLPFTHLWQPQDLAMLYNTKPCLNTTAWFLSDWVSKHVQWEVLQVFEQSWKNGIDWGAVDPDIDWHTYHCGVVTAVLRWMIDHNDANWMFRCEYPREWVGEGQWDMLWADTFDPVKGSYGGGPITSSEIAEGIHIIMQYSL
ncbi:MAG: hypothetical protein LLG44_01655 [Chloroflexi bacterium]|nr:hypothetical protein [Chloroflexota bacterium]